MPLPRGAMSWSAVSECGISSLNSLTHLLLYTFYRNARIVKVVAGRRVMSVMGGVE